MEPEGLISDICISNRPFQNAFQHSKTICSICYEGHGVAAGTVNFFLAGSGIIQHFRSMHRSIIVHDEMLKTCNELFQQLHGRETAKVVDQLSALRLQQQKDNSSTDSYSMFTVRYEANQSASSEASMDIAARNEREATKLYGLVLKNQGILKPLGCSPCILTVKQYKCDKRGRSYKVWGNDDKIYVECFIPGNRMNLFNSDRTQPLQQPQPVTANSVGKSSLFKTPLNVLQFVFGHEDFRPKQLESIEHIISGEDVIVVMPTGGGKTVIYVIPSLILPGMAVVICPLMMLMCDQVARLRHLGINACYYNTMLSDNERQSIIHNLMQQDCQYQFVFISPEAATSSQFQSCLHNLSQKKQINLFIIDEAHCVDSWGCNFRPAYQQLGILKNYGVPIVALTATATNETLVTIAEVLHMQDHTVVKMPCRRNNLSYSVIPKKESKAKNQVCELILGEFNNSCGIIYCARQADAVEMAFELKSRGISATFYHAGMDSRDRMANATLWLEDKVHVICCTNAFGMGIDKKGVRFVIHLTMPSSLEDFAQESGRGGRDGYTCTCVLLFRFEDRSFHLRNISLTATSSSKLLQLNSITEFCLQDQQCRQQFLANYFQEPSGEPCNTCDICQKCMSYEQHKSDCTVHAISVIQCLSSLIALQPKVKLSELVMTYMGSRAKEIVTKNFHTVSQYKKGKGDFGNMSNMRRFIQHLIHQGFINENVRAAEDTMSITYLTCANATDLMNGRCKVLYNKTGRE